MNQIRSDTFPTLSTILDSLNRFVSDPDGSGDLERLEDSLREFNLFAALGAINSELKHSSFLAWLLDPNENHGFGDTIVKRVLQRTLLDCISDGKITPVALDLMDLSDLEIRREWSEIDILLLSRTNLLTVVIENKIGAQESPGQLKKYRERVANDFPAADGWKHILIFLTIDGDQASDASYATLSYASVVDLLDAVHRNRQDSIGPDVKIAIQHYVQMMRRHHMEDSDLIDLARRIYLKHRPALDFIFDHRPDTWSEMRNIILSQLSQNEQLTIDSSSEKTVLIRFRPRSWARWDKILSTGTGWTSQGSNEILLCEVKPNTKRESARIQMVLGPGPKEIRDVIFSAIKEAGIYNQGYYPSWTTLLSKPYRALLNDGAATPEKSAQALLNDIKSFIVDDCPKIEAALQRAFPSPS